MWERVNQHHIVMSSPRCLAVPRPHAKQLFPLDQYFVDPVGRVVRKSCTSAQHANVYLRSRRIHLRDIVVVMGLST